MTQVDELNDYTGNEIAVIAMEGSFPGADNLTAFWENLKNAVESVSFYSETELKEIAMISGKWNNSNYIKSGGGLLEDWEFFDASFFGYTPDEALTMNPQSRAFLECAWKALESAGYDPESYNGRIGIYAGASSSFEWEAMTYLSGKIQAVGEFSAMQLGNKDFISTRVAHKLNLRGPAVMMQSACSTSLVAIHMACQAILEGECDMALAGGAAIVSPGYGYMYQEGMIFSADGHCRAFDARATGTIGGGGIGIVILKTLEEAMEDKDYIHAIVKGSAVNNDGMNKAGYSAPSREGQSKVIRSALRMANIDPETITFIETHGTGTELGDPIEIEALKQAFNTKKKNYCAIGSVKTNIGHLDAAAGVVGFIKTVLAIKNRLIPPSLHFETPNPAIDFENSPFFVNTRLMDWKRDGNPLRAGVSSLGIGGTNAHIILEEAPKNVETDHSIPEEKTIRPYQLVLISAKTDAALGRISQNLVDYLQINQDHNLENIAYTLQVGRKAFKHRRAAVCSTVEETIRVYSDSGSAKLHYNFLKEEKRPVAFMFSGQGSQYVNMGLGLYRQEPVFRTELDKCFTILETQLGCKIKEILYPLEGREEEAKAKMDHVTLSGPVKFSFEYAMAKLFMSWGIQPYALIGHSFGEYAAAQIAGVFSLEDALRLVVLRGRLMEKTPAGAMLGVPLSEDELKPLLGDDLAMAAVNAPSHCIVSGPITQVELLEKNLTEKGHDCIRINFPRASHSKLMNSIIEEFEQAASQLKLKKPQIPLISCVTGDWITLDQAVSPNYWAMHMKETVRFFDGISKLLEKPDCLFLQVSSDRGLPLFVNQHPGLKPENLVINAIRHPKDKLEDMYFLMNQLGLLWVHGVKIDWESFYWNQKKQRVPLPTYPFQGQPYKFEGNLYEIGANMLSRRGPVNKTDIADWFYIPTWTRSSLPMEYTGRDKEARNAIFNSLVFLDETGLGNSLTECLKQIGHNIVSVKIGSDFKQETETGFTINPKNKEHYERLLKNLAMKGITPNIIAHLWSIHRCRENSLDQETLAELQDRGFFSLINLAQAIGNLAIKTPIFVGVITNSLHEVNGEERLKPGSATVLGAVKILPLEYPNIYCRSIDILLPETDTPRQAIVAAQLVKELQNRSAVPIIAYRGNHRWVQSFTPFPLPKPISCTRIILKESGVYLILGGLGGIGMHLAEYIAEKVKARLILTGYSAMPPKEEWTIWLENHSLDDPISAKIKKIQKLEELGADISVIAVDVTDQSRMEETVKLILNNFGHIDGVIHAAGKPGGGAIQLQNKETLSQVLDSKVKGTVILNQVLKDIQLDFFILCSSVSSILSTFGQSGYCAANAFLDAFAEYNTTNNGKPTMAINWGRWKHTGMAASIEAKHKELTGHELSGGMTPGEAVEAFSRILGIASPRFIVIESDFLRDVDHFHKNQIEKPRENKPEHQELVLQETTRPGKSFQRPELSTEYEPPANSMQQQLAQVMETFFGYDRIGIKDDFFELGGDSLKALSLLQRIHRQLDVKITLPEFFANPTIEKIALTLKEVKQSKYISIEPVETKEYYLLSSGQKRLYILQQMAAETTAYHVTQLSQLRGEVKPRELEIALKKLIWRHESLRTSFRMLNSEPVQQVHHEVEFELEVLVAEKLESSSLKQGASFSTRTIEGFVRPFDLSQAPLLRVGVLNIDSVNYLLIVDMHHIITDGISHRLLIDEFLSISKNEELSPLKLQYKDYSEWQQRQEVKALFKKQEAYWLTELAGELPVLEMPTDYPRPPVQSYEGCTIPIEMGTRETDALKRIALEEGTTLFMVGLTMFNILLSKLCGQEDIIVGIDVSGRSHADLEHIIGMFVNNLPLRNFPTPSKTFKTLLKEVKERTLKAMENQDYPFEDMVEHMLVSRDISRNPLFDVMFSLLEMEAGAALKDRQSPEPGKKIHSGQNSYSYENLTSKFDLSLNGIERGGHLLFSFEFCTKLFKTTTIERFIGYFKQLISSVIDDTSREIAEIEIIPEAEKKLLLAEFNNTDKELLREKTFAQVFTENAAQAPDRIAVVFKDTALSYQYLNERSNQLAWWLMERGIDRDQLVGILCQRSLAMMWGILAVWKAGGAYIPIDTDYPVDRINIILKDSGAKCLLTDNEQPYSHLTGEDIHILQIEAVTAGPRENPGPIAESSDLSYVIYTSGSTGKPKGAMVEHIGMMNHLMAKVSDLGLSAASIIVQNASHTFDISVWQFFAALLVKGKTLIYPEEWVLNPELFLKKVVSNQVTILEVVPSYLAVLLEYIGTEPQVLQLHYLLVTGEEIKSHLVRKWFELFPTIKMVNAYGPTEASDDITHHVMDRAPGGERIPIGKPLQNLKIYILDKNMKLCPIGIKGEIAVSGIGVGRGYLGDEDKTRQSFFNDPYAQKPGVRLYKTGDLGRWHPEGTIEFFGRKDYQVKIRGFRIELGEIEAKLAAHPEIKENVVIAIDPGTQINSTPGETTRYLCAYYVTRAGISPVDLKEFLMKELPDYMVPAYFIRLEQMPLTPNGKLDRKALPSPGIDAGKTAAMTLPQNKIEKKLAEIWSELLGIEKPLIGIDVNFFDIGGHSLKATLLAARVHKEFEVRLPIAEIFRTPTIRDLAKLINNAATEKFSVIQPTEKKEYYPLSPAQKRLYFIHLTAPESTAYNQPITLELPGTVDKKRLEETFKQLIARHECLRTSFIRMGQEAIQRIYEKIDFTLRYDEAKPGTPEKVKEIIDHFVRPFELATPPLLRAALIKIDSIKYVLAVDIHHIITDGISDNILMNDFISLYGGRKLAILKLQYKDFSQWQNRLLESGAVKKQEEYWLKRFSDQVPILDLPTDYPRPIKPTTHQGGLVNFFIEPPLMNTLQKNLSETRTTPFIFLLAIYYILLSKYSSQEDIVVGSPVSGRKHADLKNIMGLFINMLSLRNQPAENKAFRFFLEEVKENALEAYENQEYQFDELVVKLNLHGTPGKNPLFQVIFADVDTETHSTDNSQAEIRRFEYDNFISKFDLRLAMTQTQNRILLSLQYSKVLFKKSTIEKMTSRFIEILKQVLDNNDILLKEIKLSHDLIVTQSKSLLDYRESFEF